MNLTVDKDGRKNEQTYTEKIKTRRTIRRIRSNHSAMFSKMAILENVRNSKEETCVGVFLLIKLQAVRVHLYSKETPAQVFSNEFNEIFHVNFLTEQQ